MPLLYVLIWYVDVEMLIKAPSVNGWGYFHATPLPAYVEKQVYPDNQRRVLLHCFA